MSNLIDKNKLDILAFGAHPDDVELCCGGTVLSLVAKGYKVGVVDISEGELSSRGSVDLRREETAVASRFLGIEVRENLGIPDGGIELTKANREKVMEVIRKYRPEIILANPLIDRHPDHAHAASLVVESCFYSGLKMLPSRAGYDVWRPKHILHYMQSVYFEPDIIVDVGEYWDQRQKAMLAYSSQFNVVAEENDQAQTYISSQGYLEWIEARAKVLGYRIGAIYGEGFTYSAGAIGTDDLVDLLKKQPRR